MFKNILTRVCEDTGYHPTQDRQAIINLVDRAAFMLYNRLECNAIYREVTCLVPENKVIALPSFVGPLRGIKEAVTDINFDLNTQSYPRFVKNDWQYKWKNWVELRSSCIHTSLPSVAPLTFTVAAVETVPITIKIVGQTANSQRIEEELVLDATSKETANSFGPNLFTIACFNTGRVYDVTVKDDDGNTIAVLYNNEEKTEYKLYDISQYSWSKDVADGTTAIEILYKHPYFRMQNDADEFPADGYDNAIYFQSIALWAAPQTGKEALTSAMQAQALIEPKATRDNDEQKMNKKMQFGRNPLYNAIRPRLFNSRYYTNTTYNG